MNEGRWEQYWEEVLILERSDQWCPTRFSVGPNYVSGIYINDIKDDTGAVNLMNSFDGDARIQIKNSKWELMCITQKFAKKITRVEQEIADGI